MSLAANFLVCSRVYLRRSGREIDPPPRPEGRAVEIGRSIDVSATNIRLPCCARGILDRLFALLVPFPSRYLAPFHEIRRGAEEKPRSCVFDHPRLIAQPDKPTVRHRIPRFSQATSPVSVMFVLCNPRMTCFFFTSSRSRVTRARVIFGKTTYRNFDLAQFQRSAPMPRFVSRYTRFRGFVKSPADE